MKVKDIIKNADMITVARIYDDGTRLYVILVGEKAYSIRINPKLLQEKGQK
jgi:hypothetical protein